MCFRFFGLILAKSSMGPREVDHISAFVTPRVHKKGYLATQEALRCARLEETLPSLTLKIVTEFARPEYLVEIGVWTAAYDQNGQHAGAARYLFLLTRGFPLELPGPRICIRVVFAGKFDQRPT